MPLIRTLGVCASLAAIATGCRTTPKQSEPCIQQCAPAQSARPVVECLPATTSSVVRASHNEPLPQSFQAEELPLGANGELSLAWLMAEIQARNPSLQAMEAAWRAAAERYPQVVALDDPMFASTLAPASFNSPTVEGAYALELAQKFPWFGKRAARGRSAQAEANAAFRDVEDVRLRLAEASQIAFFDYYLVRRQQELNQWNTDVMRQFRDTAQSKYRANQVTQQDILQADVELAKLERRQLELQRMNAVAIARINTLLHRPPNAPLCPPPAQLNPVAIATNLCLLQQIAAQQRPDLASISAQIRAQQAAVDLANKEYFPDTEVFGRYDTFWQPASTQGDLRGQVGVRLNVPIYRDRRHAAVREASYKLSQKQAEFDQKRLDVEYEVQQAYAQFEESRQALKLYSDKFVPITEQNVAAARSNYDVGKLNFLELATTQRQLIEVREQHQEALAAYFRRIAELERVIGGPLPTPLASPLEEIAVPLKQ